MKYLALPDVTLVMIETQLHELASKALGECILQAMFGDIIVFTDDNSKFNYAGVKTFVSVPNWETRNEWEQFSWYEVGRHLVTSHALYAQWDGWVIDPTAWTDEFLQYDYIGAPWWFVEGGNVGNSGFSLRSKRLLEYINAQRETYSLALDDQFVCREYRPSLEKAGFKWAPDDVAHRFAFDKTRQISITHRYFGFHGIENWPLVLPFDRLQERVKIAKESEYLKASGALLNLTNTLFEHVRAEKDRAVKLNESTAENRYIAAFNMLRAGDIKRGFEEFECRWGTKFFQAIGKVGKLRKTFAHIPQWTGEPLTDRSIVIWHEQGYGDTLLVFRYIRKVQEYAGLCVVGVPEAMVSLLKDNGINAVHVLPDDVKFDFHCPVMSLPLAFSAAADNIPEQRIEVPPDRMIRAHIPDNGKLKVGLTWHGSNTYAGNKHRSIPINDFMTITRGIDADFYALQYELVSDDRWVLDNNNVTPLKYEDFSELAVHMWQLDLIISTCTVVPNLSASIGKPTWLLLSTIADWRWNRGETSLWYPRARLFRQDSLDNWVPVIARVRAELNKVIKLHPEWRSQKASTKDI